MLHRLKKEAKSRAAIAKDLIYWKLKYFNDNINRINKVTHKKERVKRCFSGKESTAYAMCMHGTNNGLEDKFYLETMLVPHFLVIRKWVCVTVFSLRP